MIADKYHVRLQYHLTGFEQMEQVYTSRVIVIPAKPAGLLSTRVVLDSVEL
jgi:hypothetical protein